MGAAVAVNGVAAGGVVAGGSGRALVVEVLAEVVAGRAEVHAGRAEVTGVRVGVPVGGGVFVLGTEGRVESDAVDGPGAEAGGEIGRDAEQAHSTSASIPKASRDGPLLMPRAWHNRPGAVGRLGYF